MNIEKLIEDLRIACAGNQHNIMGVAATALSTFQAENEKLRAELEQVKAERDAAVRDLKLCAGFDDSLCHFCKTDSEECSSCISGTRWQWRGPQEE